MDPSFRCHPSVLTEVAPDVFADWLAKGLGRAAIYLKLHPSAPHRDAIERACLYGVQLDPQMEDSRAFYLYNLTRLTEHPQHYRDLIRSTLLKFDDHDDDIELSQLMELARHFAADGDSGMRDVMYATIKAEGYWRYGAKQIVKLDGFAGLDFVLSLNVHALRKDWEWGFESLFEAAVERDGKQSSYSPKVQRFLRENEARRRARRLRCKRRRRRTRRQPPATYKHIRRSLKSLEDARIVWIKRATDRDLRLAAEDAMQESNPIRSEAILRLFWHRKFPGPVEWLLKQVQHQDPNLTRQAINALSNFTDPRVRTLGLELLAGGERPDLGADLLVNNWEPGDLERIRACVNQVTHPKLLHYLLTDFRNALEREQHPDRARYLLDVYERYPCAFCREYTVRDLLELNAVPDWMREECCYDSERETRALFGAATSRYASTEDSAQ